MGLIFIFPINFYFYFPEKHLTPSVIYSFSLFKLYESKDMDKIIQWRRSNIVLSREKKELESERKKREEIEFNSSTMTEKIGENQRQ